MFIAKKAYITACTVVQAVVKATSQSNGKGQILTPWGSVTPERISMKLGTYNRGAGMTTHANPYGAATTWVVWANTWKSAISSERFDRSSRNLARWRIFGLRMGPEVEISNFWKSKMAAAAILKYRKLAYLLVVRAILTIFGTVTHNSE